MSDTPEVVYDDPIFFHKSQVSVGTVIQYYGRLNPGERWRVTTIVSHDYVKGHIWKETNPDTVNYLTDRIILSRIRKPGTQRNVSFANVSYSAIWRIVR